MSGEGAYLYGGRWNSPGTRMVYLGSSIAQAAFELLVHLKSADVLNRFSKMEVAFDSDQVLVVDDADLPVHWREEAMSPRVQATGDAWVHSGQSLVLEVPSIAVPGATNYLINPLHPEFSTLKYGGITTFNYDSRIIKK